MAPPAAASCTPAASLSLLKPEASSFLDIPWPYLATTTSVVRIARCVLVQIADSEDAISLSSPPTFSEPLLKLSHYTEGWYIS